MTTTENTRPGVWISVSAVGTDYVRISADIPNDRLDEATRALAAVVTPTTPKEGMPSVEARSRAVLADEDACRRVDDDAHAHSDQPAVEPAQAGAQLEEIVKLLRDIAEHTAPKIIRLQANAALAGTTLADEDACRRVADVDKDGPDCEGPEGGESA